MCICFVVFFFHSLFFCDAVGIHAAYMARYKSICITYFLAYHYSVLALASVSGYIISRIRYNLWSMRMLPVNNLMRSISITNFSRTSTASHSSHSFQVCFSSVDLAPFVGAQHFNNTSGLVRAIRHTRDLSMRFLCYFTVAGFTQFKRYTIFTIFLLNWILVEK